MSAPVLEISDLSVRYPTAAGPASALRHVDLRVGEGEILGVVGESGSGKSTLIAAVMRLFGGGGRIAGGAIRFMGRDLCALDEDEMRVLRGGGMALVGQNPMSAFNPVLSIGRQLIGLQHRDAVPDAEKRKRALAILRRVGIADPDGQWNRYPTAFSGGMLQRMAIAAALLTRPRLLIADEPTTALDMRLESQILVLLRGLRDEMGCSILFVSHHLGAVARLCDRVAVLYAGEVMESGPTARVFSQPSHPYTARLLACDPAAAWAPGERRFPAIGGAVPDLARLPEGCVFAPRCGLAGPDCLAQRPAPRAAGPDLMAACHRVTNAEPA